jgi:hypothetical protein
MKMLKSGLFMCSLTILWLTLISNVKADLIGYWPLNETSGVTATNLADGGVIGILTNGPTWMNDAERGNILSFDGSDDHVIAGSTPPIGIYSNFTWSFWAYSQETPNNDVILGNRWNTDSQTGSIWIKFTPSKFEYTGSTFLDYENIPQNQWIHHAVVKLRNTLTYYRNGIATTNGAVTGDIISRPFYMGGDRFSERWHGRLDDVAIWTDALPSNAIAGLADGTYTPLTAPHYPTSAFDLSDAVGGGDGRLPGYGGGGDLGATEGIYTPFPNNLFVDGTFVPNSNTTAIVIDGAGHTYDFNAQTAENYVSVWRNGNNFDTYPVDTNSLPNFLGDPDNHSFLAGHANKGITFDLDAVRDFTGNSISNFTACIGDSRPKPGGSISYFVFVDGVLVKSRFGITNDEDFITVDEVSSGRYLTIAICDANDNKSADHGYLGDPFLNLIPYTPPAPPKGTMILIL